MFKILISSVCILFVLMFTLTISSKQLDDDCNKYTHPLVARIGIMLCTAIFMTGVFVFPTTIVLKLFGAL